MDNPDQIQSTRWARGGSQSDLRRHNERAVLSTVDRHPGLFNAELARRTGLAAQTISVILKSLEDQKLIIRGSVLRGRRGQPATPIFLNPQGAHGLGAEIGLRKIAMTRVDLSGAVTGGQTWRHAYPDPETSIASIVAFVRTMLEVDPRPVRDDAIFLGLATPRGLLDGRPLPGLPERCAAQWAQTDLRSVLESQLQMPVLLIEEGIAGCGAQVRQNGLPADFAYLHIGPMLVSGIVLDGNVHAGRDGQMLDFGLIGASEVSGVHVTAEEVLSIVALEKWLALRGIIVPDGLDADSAMEHHGDAIQAWIGQAAPVLAHLALTIEAVVALGAILIDGDLPSPILKALIAAAHPEMEARASSSCRLPTLYRGTLGDKAIASGAARAPLQRAYFSAPDGGARSA